MPSTGLVGHESPVSLGVFSRTSFAIQPRPRLRTLLDGAGPQAHGVAVLALVQPPPVRTYLPLAIDVEMGSRTAVCVRKRTKTLIRKLNPVVYPVHTTLCPR